VRLALLEGMVGVKVLVVVVVVVVVVVGLDHWGHHAQVIPWSIQILMGKGLTWSSM